MKFEVEPYKYDGLSSDQRAAFQRRYDELSRKDRRFVRGVEFPAIQGMFLESVRDREFIRKNYWLILKEMRRGVLAPGKFGELANQYRADRKIKKKGNSDEVRSWLMAFAILRDSYKKGLADAEEISARVKCRPELEGLTGLERDVAEKELAA